MATKEIYRPTMSSDVIFELVDILESQKRTVGLSTNMRKFLSKLDTLAYEIGKGTRAPAYVATGAKKSPEISIEALGGNDNLILDRRGNPKAIDKSNYTSEQLSDAEFAAADHYAQTGVRLPIEEFLPKLIPIIERRKEDDSNDKELANELFKSL